MPDVQTCINPGAGLPTHARNIPETERINFLMQRDGEESARAWVERTLQIYRDAVNNPNSHASKKEYKILFLQAIEEFENWLILERSIQHDLPS